MTNDILPHPKVLLIEDDTFLVGMYVAKMELEQFQTYVASDGEKGLALAREVHPDLILLDILLPTVDGFQVLGELKDSAATKDIPVVLLTNMGQKKDVERGLALGASEYMIKAHYMPSEVIDHVKQIIIATRAGIKT